MNFIQCKYEIKIPNALKTLLQYVLKYCSDSLEILELRNYPFFILKRPLNKLHEFNLRVVFKQKGNAVWKHWNEESLKLMANIRSHCSKNISKTFSKIGTGLSVIEQRRRSPFICFIFEFK